MAVRIHFVICWMLGAVLSAGTVQIIHTSDLHACLTGAEGRPSPWLQLATVIGQLRRQAGDQSTIHIDTGDTMQGTLIGTLTRGLAPLRALQAMKCDAWIPGNHDFDFGPQAFAEGATMLSSIIICGNLQPANGVLPSWPSWKLFERGGCRVAVIGSTASYLRHWFLQELSNAYLVDTARAQLRRVLPEVLKANPEVIVLALHQGWVVNDRRGVNEVAQIAEEFPEIDLILGGHTHRAIPGRQIGPHAWYMQPPPHGQALAVAEVVCDDASRRVRSITSRLIYPDAQTAEDGMVRRALAGDLAVAEKYEKSVVAPAPGRTISATGRPGQSNAMSQLFCAAIRHATGAEVVMHGVLSSASLPAGRPVTGKMLFDVVPYDNTMVTCQVTAAQLEAIIAEQWRMRKSYTYCGLYNACATIAADGGAHLQSVNGAPPDSARRYLLALNSFTAAGGGRYPVLEEILSRPECSFKNTGRLTRDALQEYLKLHPGLVVTPEKYLVN